MSGPAEPRNARGPARRILIFSSPAAQAGAAFIAVLLPTLLLSPAPSSPSATIQSVCLQFLLVGSVPLFFAHLLNLDKRTAFSLRRARADNLFWCLVLVLSALFWLDEVVFWQDRLTGIRASLNPEVERLLRADSIPQLGWILFALAVTPAVCEELLFRGFMLGRFLEFSQPGQGLMMTSVLFGLFHRNLPALLPTSLAGLLLAFVVWRTGNLSYAIPMHAAINGWAILVVNSRIGELLPWTRQPSPVPAVLLLGGGLGLVVAAWRLKPDGNPQARSALPR